MSFLAFLLVFVLFSISRLAEKFRIENHLQGLKLSRLLITNKFDKQGMVGQINNFMVNTISLYTSVCLYTQFFCSFGLFHLPPFMCISFTPLHLFFPLVWPPPPSTFPCKTILYLDQVPPFRPPSSTKQSQTYI